MQAVPTADVIVTNPTHYAVALKYDAATMNAPPVIWRRARRIGHAHSTARRGSSGADCRESAARAVAVEVGGVGDAIQTDCIKRWLKCWRTCTG